MSQKLKFLRRILTLGVLVVLVLLIVRWCSKDDGPDFTIDDTPMRVERIRSIAELATISYQDEVVVDSIEFYKDGQEQFAGSITKLIDPKDFKYGLNPSNIKRRLTLLVKGEVKYGFDLKQAPIKIQETDSLIQVFLPQPKIIDLQVTPTGTEFIQENGRWQDYEIRSVNNKARQKLTYNAELLNLRDQAKSNMTMLMKQLLAREKAFEVNYQ